MEAYDTKNEMECVVKFNRKKEMNEKEANVLVYLQMLGYNNFPRILKYGTYDSRKPYILMEKLGPSLN